MKRLALRYLKCLYRDSTTRWQSQRNDARWTVWGNPTLTNPPQPKIDFLIELCRSTRPVYWQDPGGSYLEGLPLSHVVFRQEQLLIFTKKLAAHRKKEAVRQRSARRSERKTEAVGNNKVIWTLQVVVFMTASVSCHNTVTRKLERFPPRTLKANWCSRLTNDLPDHQPDAAARLPDCPFQKRAVCLISPNRSKGRTWHRSFLWWTIAEESFLLFPIGLFLHKEKTLKKKKTRCCWRGSIYNINPLI